MAPAPELATVWLGNLRESAEVRTRLGWAASGPTAYTLYEQCARVPEAINPQCFVSASNDQVFIPTLTDFSRPDAAGVSVVKGNYAWATVTP